MGYIAEAPRVASQEEPSSMNAPVNIDPTDDAYSLPLDRSM